MKDIEIHNGLENKEVRDFLAKSIIDAAKIDVNKQVAPYHESNWDYFIAQQKCIIENSNSLIKRYEVFKSVETIAKLQNWQEFDISEIVERTDGKFHRSFYGTQSEFDNFKKTLKSN